MSRQVWRGAQQVSLLKQRSWKILRPCFLINGTLQPLFFEKKQGKPRKMQGFFSSGTPKTQKKRTKKTKEIGKRKKKKRKSKKQGLEGQGSSPENFPVTMLPIFPVIPVKSIPPKHLPAIIAMFLEGGKTPRKAPDHQMKGTY